MMKGRIAVWRAAKRARRNDALHVRVSLESARLRRIGLHPDCIRARYARSA